MFPKFKLFFFLNDLAGTTMAPAYIQESFKRRFLFISKFQLPNILVGLFVVGGLGLWIAISPS